MEFLMFLAFFGFMLKLLFLALIVWVVVSMVKRGRFGRGWNRQQFSRLMGEDNALQIARKRFANGEISREEYEALKRALT